MNPDPLHNQPFRPALYNEAGRSRVFLRKQWIRVKTCLHRITAPIFSSMGFFYRIARSAVTSLFSFQFLQKQDTPSLDPVENLPTYHSLPPMLGEENISETPQDFNDRSDEPFS